MKKILFVDDEPNVLAAFQRQLHKQYAVETALGPEAGLAALRNWKDYAVVVADMRMPKMDGVEFLSKAKEIAPDVVRMMLTGNADQDTAIEAINQGNIFRFLNKPCAPDRLSDALNCGLRQHQLITAERELLEDTLCASIKVLTDILAISDPKSSSSAALLRDNVRQIAKSIGITQSWPLEAAAMLSQIGLVTVPPELALKARLGHPLSTKEQEMYAKIPEIGAKLLGQIPRLEEVSQIIRYQYKYFDGSGFPEDSVLGTAIPFGSRLIRIIGDLTEIEAAGSTRSVALRQLRNRKGSYDPSILDALESSSSVVLESKAPVPITFQQLRIGHLLRSDVLTRDGTLIVVAGHRITDPLMEKLQNFRQLSGIREPLYVDPA